MKKMKSEDSYPITDHYDGKRFFNPGVEVKKSFRKVLKMLNQGRGKNKWPAYIENTATPNVAKQLSDHEVYITYINHATHLIQLQGLTILTDPVFSKRAGPWGLIGPKRVRKPGIPLKKLPIINTVLISHNHYDHMDLASLTKLEKMFQPLFIVPLGNRCYLKHFQHVIEIDWWQAHQITATQSVTLVPAQHWSMRKFGDANCALWGGFWIQSGALKIYFAGDSGYGPHFKQIKEKLGAPTLSILPIGAYEPRWFMKEQHMNPEEAVLASLDLNSQLTLANHHQTFRLSHEAMTDPVIELQESMKRHGINENCFLTPENGETIIYDATQARKIGY